MHRHLPVNNRTSFLPDTIDYTTAFPVMSGLLVIAAIAIGAGFLKRTGSEPPKVNTPGIAQDFKAIYSQSDEPLEPELASAPGDAPPLRLASAPPPRTWSPPPAVSVPSRRNQKMVHVKVGFVTPDETNSSQIAVETNNLTYSTHLGAYVGSVVITNKLRDEITDFSVALDVDGNSYRMLPFTGDPTAPKPLEHRTVPSGGTLTCPVIAEAPEPAKGAMRSIRITAQVRGRGTIEVHALAP